MISQNRGLSNAESVPDHSQGPAPAVVDVSGALQRGRL